MALLIQGLCLDDAAQALLKANTIFPQLVSGGSSTAVPQVISLTSSSLAFTTGIYTYSTKNQLGTVSTTNGTMTFPSCTDSDIPFNPSAMIFGVGLIIIFLIAFSIGSSK